MEIYVFGLVVFWVLFQGVLFNEWQLQESTSHGGNRFKWLKSHIQRLKDDKLLGTYAQNMVDELGDIGDTRKHDLRTFFDMTVQDDLEQRASAFTHILPLIQGSKKQ